MQCNNNSMVMIVMLALGLALGSGQAYANSNKLLWGDTHLHTSFSPDAYFLLNRSTTPDSAYRFAKGLPVIHPFTKDKARIGTPLDFLVVSDHAEWMGIPRALFAGDERLANTEAGRDMLELVEQGKSREVARRVIASASYAGTDQADDTLAQMNNPEIRTSAWHNIAETADRHNEPGKFSAIIGWEWSSLTAGANLHRIVMMSNNARTAKKFLPYSLLDSYRPEDLWNWLERTSKDTGADFIAIPHNSNLSKGKMFARVDSYGRPFSSAYARTRARWEPIVEITQFKGDSETHPMLSPTDEFANYEFYPRTIDSRPPPDGEPNPTITEADYVRPALKTGLELEGTLGVNPYKFGIIGSTDSHTGMSTAEENNFMGKFPNDSIPERKQLNTISGAQGWDMGAAGLAAVWAKDNTREDIIAAFKRREVYGTTGPRIRLRFFAGYDFGNADAEAHDIAETGYAKGVPMGSELTRPPNGQSPKFLVYAAKDPKSANLDRIQIVKGYIDADGKAKEVIHNIAWAGRRFRLTGRLRAVGNTVNTQLGTYDNSIGAAQLAGVWEDPDFDAGARAFYYVRVLEIPSPRHSLLDAVALGKTGSETKRPLTIQERAYSSPIWYTP